MKCWQPTLTFTAIVGRKSNHAYMNHSSMLLHNVAHTDGVLFRDHIWIKLSKHLLKQNLKLGTTIQFQAKTKFYASPESLYIKKVGLSAIKQVITTSSN